MYKDSQGVYIIQSISKPERVYIGSTALSIKGRWNNHKQALRAGKHHSPMLQRHFNKYGEADLAFEIIESGEYLDKNHLLSREQGWYIPYAYKETELPYFNWSKLAGSPLGVKRSPEFCKQLGDRSRGKKRSKPAWNKGMVETEEQLKKRSEAMLSFFKTEKGENAKKKISKKNKGKKKPEGFGAKISEATKGEKHHMFGKHISPETSAKMSEARMGNTNCLGYKASAETKAKLSEKSKRENLSEETLEKMRQSQLGRKHSEETKKKISNGNIGKVLSDETKEKIRISKLGENNPGYGKKQPKDVVEKRISAMKKTKALKKLLKDEQGKSV